MPRPYPHHPAIPACPVALNMFNHIATYRWRLQTEPDAHTNWPSHNQPARGQSLSRVSPLFNHSEGLAGRSRVAGSLLSLGTETLSQ